MERPKIGIDELLESSEDSRSVEASQHKAAPCRPYAFPKLRRSHILKVANNDSHSPKGHSTTPASDLAQDANDAGTSLHAIEAPNATLRETPSLPNPFDDPLVTNADVRVDALRLVRLVDISVGHRLRGIIDEFIPVMVGSLSTNDVIQPVVVRPDPMNPGKFLLVAGLQRLNAARTSGEDQILCRVVGLTDEEAELWEIEENLVRSPFTPAQEALAIDRCRELHEQLHGKPKARGAAAANRAMGRAHASASVADASPSFVETTARRIGKSARSVQRIVQRASRNGRNDLERVVGTSLDRGNELDTLPMLPLDTREALIKEAAAGQDVSAVDQWGSGDSPMSYRQSRGGLISAQPGDQPVKCDEGVRGLAALQAAWHEASVPAREAFLAWIDETNAAATTLESQSFEAFQSEDGK
ncbi:hypothetical protein ABIF38_003430 [Bradyrhizobium japonicum]|uniref:ParB-like N-terminal domain-containing protein n=1 Tax=Bradyrhizobium elkanii TaxID=29448 RepID=A0ABV4FA89_BRAEL|nr:ParB N-terminal domain-containing protein [Bradyrhizobium elkanii]MBP2432425.1 hypothetical protein [Bradyrhizobium elkanii]MCP1734256.1 hypothetical protein [Bradyrhizobium elkanii]MCP1751938.1 hypothetical protein [Bradyrhizobium elkanii]MCP1977709.1 hypothetical protein [Bradyrhizobium elkanii]MCS3569593.1 hypothetical protein [Bradyrhizobium elkanii]